MALIVHKYGGTSMGSVERIKNVAKRVAKWHKAGHKMVVVPSAMSGETNRLLGLAKEISGSANGQLIDSTNDTLSHETSETISDPNLNAWWVHRLTIANGEEIGDLCVRAQIIGNNIYSKDGTIILNGHPYTIQAEYSDEVHGCPYSTAP